VGVAAVLGGLVGGLLGLGLLLGRLLWRGRRWWVAPAVATVVLVAVLTVWRLPSQVQGAWLALVVAGTLLGAPWSACPGGWGVRERTTEDGLRPAGGVEKVWQGDEPPPRLWAVPKLVPYGPRARWRPARWWLGRWMAVPVLWPVLRGYVTAVLGSGGVGKSYLLCDLALALLTGTPWLGQRTTRVRSVLYVDAELDVDTMRQRAWESARGRGLRRPPRGLHYYPLPASVATAAGRALVARAARRCRAQLVLFDSLTIGAAGAGLSDQNAWNRVLAGMEQWGVPVVLIDHMPKSGGTMVGSFMKQARVRSALSLELDERTGAILVAHEKHNFSAKVPDFRVRPVFLHADPDDPAPGVVRFELIAPALVEKTSTGGSPMGEPRWAPREQAALDAWATVAPGGATVGEIAVRLQEADPATWGDRSYKTVLVFAKRLEKGGALRREADRKVPGRPPAAVYVAVGVDAAADAVAQAEQLLRRRAPSAPGPSGGAGGRGAASSADTEEDR
jgi:hypothetical protein